MASTAVVACPACGSVIHTHEGYLTWCGHCDWNLDPSPPEEPTGLIEKMRRSLGDRFGRRLLESLIATRTLQPRLTPAMIAAYAISLIVHLVTLAVIVGGVLLMRAWPSPVAIFLGLLCFGLAYLLRPRPNRFPKQPLSRQHFPELYGIVDRIGEHLGLGPIDAIEWSTDVNGAFYQTGLRRRSVICVGMPLLAMADAAEREAFLAHEIAHGVNGDIARKMIVHHAITALKGWHDWLMPSSLTETIGTMPGLFAIVTNLIRAGFAQVPRGALYLLHWLMFHESQRAEYLADHLSASVAGSDAVVSLLTKLYADPIVEIAVQRATINPASPGFLAELRSELARMPASELERMRRIARAAGSRLDSSHPPTPYRIDFMEARPMPRAGGFLTPERNAALERELELLYPAMERSLIDQYRRRIY